MHAEEGQPLPTVVFLHEDPHNAKFWQLLGGEIEVNLVR